MEFRGHKKVHIVSVGFEIDRVVQPVRQIGADKVVILVNQTERPPYVDVIHEVERQLREFLPKGAIEERPTTIFDHTSVFATLGDAILKEKAEGNYVFVNISSGTRLFGAAGHLASIMFGATAYYAEPEKYRTEVRDFVDQKTKRPLGISAGVRKIVRLPAFALDPPRTDLVRVLGILRDAKGRASQSQIIGKLADLGVMSDVLEKHSVSKKAHAEFRRRYLEPLLSRRWVDKHGSRRGASLVLTDEGSEVLLMFSFLIQPSPRTNEKKP